MDAIPELRFSPRWADVDANRHMRHSAYADYGAHARVELFCALGFDMARFEALELGPVLLREELIYRREVAMGQEVLVRSAIAALSPQADRLHIAHTMRKVADDQVAAHIRAEIAWMDLRARRLISPPEALRAALHAAPRADDFQVLTRP